MPSPFPGMDPYLEIQEWEDFHTSFNTVVKEVLAPKVEPRYVVRVERRVYVEHPSLQEARVRWGRRRGARHGGQDRAVHPQVCLLPMPQERRETFLVIRDRETLEVVTVLETLSPSNKQAGGEGREMYLTKRDGILESRTHLVELDLLRGGLRLPAIGGLPPGDYYAVISRSRDRPRAAVYAWGVRQPMPSIPIPLKDEDPETSLDLQAVFTTVYDRARYHLSLDYEAPLDPAFAAEDQAWARDAIQRTGPR